MSRRLPAARSLPGESGRASRAFAAGVAVVLALPVVVIVGMSFNSSPFLNFPPSGLTFEWYEELFGDLTWTRAFRQSGLVALLSSLLAAALATCAALGVRDHRRRRWFEALFLLPLIVPVIVTALMLFTIYAELQILGTTLGLVLAHALLAFPYAFLVVSGAVHAIDRRLERAAESMGCTPWQTLWRVVLPLLAPAIFAAALVAAVVSFDEVVATLFLSSPQTRTVPVVMWSFVREEIQPTVAVASALVMVVNVAVMLVAAWLSTRMVKKRVAQAKIESKEIG